MNYQRVAVLLGGILISGSLIFMGPIKAQAPWPDPPNRVKGSKLLGQKRAEIALKTLKEKYPNINIDLESLSKSVTGKNLMEAIRNQGYLCAEARELLPQACEKVSVDGHSWYVGSVENIAKNASCKTVEGLLEYCTNQENPPGDQGQGLEESCETGWLIVNEKIGGSWYCGCGTSECAIFY